MQSIVPFQDTPPPAPEPADAAEPGGGITGTATDPGTQSILESAAELAEDAATAAITATVGPIGADVAERTRDAVGTATDTGIDGAASTISAAASDPVGTAAGGAADLAGDVVFGPGISVLNAAGADMAGTAFGDLATTASALGTPAAFVLAGWEVQIHMLASYIAFTLIVVTLAWSLLMPGRRMGKRISWLGQSTIRFAIVNISSVVIGIWAIEASAYLTSEAMNVTLPDGAVDTTGANLYTGALATIAVPLARVVFSMHGFVVALLIAFLPLSTAISYVKSFRRLFDIHLALIGANVLWPPIAGLFIGKAFAALPDVAAANYWAMGAVVAAIACNAAAFIARSD